MFCAIAYDFTADGLGGVPGASAKVNPARAPTVNMAHRRYVKK
jgi:hypothetical protein